MQRSPILNTLVFVLLVAIGAGSRFVDAAPNFAAVAAVALFAGFFFASRALACAVPVAAMLISDAFIGRSNLWEPAVVYACLCLPVLVGARLGARPGPWRVLGASMLCSIVFFVFTNLAVWVFQSMYSKDLAGLGTCYIAAWPFFRYTLAGDLAFSGAIFGAYLLANRAALRQVRPSPAPAPA